VSTFTVYYGVYLQYNIVEHNVHGTTSMGVQMLHDNGGNTDAEGEPNSDIILVGGPSVDLEKGMGKE
jgi:hypothetical protein